MSIPVGFTFIFFIIVLLLWRLWKEEKQRRTIEKELKISQEQLEKQVKLRTRELENSKGYIEKIYQSAPYGMLVCNVEGKIESINEQTKQIFGYDESELVGKSVEILIPERFHSQHIEERTAYAADSQTKVMGNGRTLSGIRKNRKEFPIEVGLSSVKQTDGLKIIASINDVSDLNMMQKKLMEEHERAVVTLRSIGDGVISTDIGGSIKSINAVAEKLTGWDAKEAQGQHISTVFRVVNEKTRKITDDPVIECLKKIHSDEHVNKVLIHKSGMNIPIEDNVSPIHSSNGNIIGIVLVFHDVSQARQHAQEIEYQANHDALTGLVNRREFDLRLRKTLKENQGIEQEHVLLFMDLDRFKLVNDTAGHAAGDDLLIQLTKAMSKQLRHRDTFARLGGDEFGVILENCSCETGFKLANLLRKTVDDFKFYWNEQIFNVGVSIGLMPYMSTAKSVDALLSEADAACYMAKESGRNRVQIYDSSSARKLNESHIVNLLTTAFEKEQMQLYQQTIQATSQANQNHYEILIRMIDEKNNIIPPGMFLPAAEHYGLATNIDRWVIRNTFKWMEKHQTDFNVMPNIAINVSGQSMTDSLFCDFVRQLLLQYKIKPSSICFEITETAAMHNLDTAKLFINELKQFGCQFALDDFGSGQAAYAQLKHLPVDYLKIDGSLVKGILDDEIDFSIVKSINEVGKVLGIKTIAEFVENDAIADKLETIGIDYLQGYGINRPAPIDSLLK